VAVALRGSADDIQLEIVDEGIGFDPDAVMSGCGLGLVGMQERARVVGGDLFIESRPGRGTSVRARVPTGDTGRSVVED
jgi:signal transduction histidine kinase